MGVLFSLSLDCIKCKYTQIVHLYKTEYTCNKALKACILPENVHKINTTTYVCYYTYQRRTITPEVKVTREVEMAVESCFKNLPLPHGNEYVDSNPDVPVPHYPSYGNG